MAGAVAMFFRDPERRIPRRPGLILSPADGKVISIEEIEVEPEAGRRERLRCVRIFLSIFNAHVQRAPAEGAIATVKYVRGKFLNALDDKSSDENEHNMVWMRGRPGAIGVKQIAGIIARRVVCTCRSGQHVAAGQRIGLIRFGSRAEAYFPLDAVVKARVGQKVKAGLSVLAVAPSETSEAATSERIRP
jgi:phosphatidylserine decarboxylase